MGRQGPLNALFTALAAGAMIFVSVHELLPMAGLVLSVPVYVLLRSIVPG